MIGSFIFLCLFIVLIWLVLKLPKKPIVEMTAAERMSYEQERGRLIAQQEYEGRK
jgi:hypothetical protein